LLYNQWGFPEKTPYVIGEDGKTEFVNNNKWLQSSRLDGNRKSGKTLLVLYWCGFTVFPRGRENAVFPGTLS